MGLFKSKEERRIERKIVVKKALSNFKRKVSRLEQDEKNYLVKAIRAKKLGNNQLLKTLKSQIRRSQMMRARLENGMLTLETAVQAKEQIESFEDFGKAMSAVSKSIEQAYGIKDLARTQKEYEMAMGKASNMEERIDIFLEGAFDTIEDVDESEVAGVMGMDEIDKLIENQAVESEDIGVDEDIESKIAEIKKEISNI
jgi:hypothetical protein